MKNLFKKLVLTSILLIPIMGVNAEVKDITLSKDSYNRLGNLNYSTKTSGGNCLGESYCHGSYSIENGKVVISTVNNNKLTVDVSDPISVKGTILSQSDNDAFYDYIVTKSGDVYYVEGGSDSTSLTPVKLDVANVVGIASDESLAASGGNIPESDPYTDAYYTMYRDGLLTFILKDSNGGYYYAVGKDTGKISVPEESNSDENSQVESENDDILISPNEGSDSSNTYMVIIIAMLAIILIMLIFIIASGKDKSKSITKDDAKKPEEETKKEESKEDAKIETKEDNKEEVKQNIEDKKE